MGIPELDTSTLKLAVYLSEWIHPHDLPFYIPTESFSPRFGTQFFTIQCTGWEITNDETTSSSFIVYIFKISRGRQENVVRIRYSEMLEFRAVLTSIPIIGGDHVDVIPFPPKCYAPWNRYRASVLDERVEQLNEFLRKLFRVNLLYPGLKCVRELFGFDAFDTSQEWWMETGYGAIRKNTFHTPRVIRKSIVVNSDDGIHFQKRRRRSAGRSRHSR